MAQQMIWDSTTCGIYARVDADNPLKVTTFYNQTNAIKTTIPLGSGKYYFEYKVDYLQSGLYGVCNESFNTAKDGVTNTNHISLFENGNIYPSLKPSGCGTVIGSGIVGVKIDTINKIISFAVNNKWGTEFAITGEKFYPVLMNYGVGQNSVTTANFGATPFTYDVPEGFIGADNGGGSITGSLLLKANDKYYSIKEDYYDTATQQYKELTITDLATDIETYGFNNIEDLMTEVTIGSKTFKPIDKFDKFSIVSIEEKNIEVQGLKDDKELIISNQNLSTVIASAIHNFVLDATKMSNGDIKFVISDDNGLTWKTWNGTSWDTLTHTCPLTDDNKVKQYSQLSDSEKNKWNQLKEEIWTSGIETDTADIDYDLLDKNVRFAFVLYRPSYADKITLKNLSIVCDKIGNWHKLSESDIDIAINVNSCSVTAKQNNLTNVKVNILI
ncbi:hypothetical protein PMX22_09880 [Clostridium butyricum]|uniref:hypothetical protein n=1 Tax=Clostridium butyricum TaxID=1492 RepID=UPI00232E64E5|nr:hypothetical protein [Clostridium butyricum]MDB2160109.1 hypothetical protein [Clostridium butyricum]